MLPPEILGFAKTHNFAAVEELPPGYCSRIFTDGPRILKYPFQGEEQTSGALAALELQIINGPQIFAFHTETGSLIMERIPGNESLLSMCYQESQYSPSQKYGDPSDEPPFIDLALKMRTLPTKNCMDLSQVYSNTPAITRHLIETTTEITFLHGDLHHENILFDPRTSQFRPIDPKGLVGDPNFECVAFLRNPIESIPTHPDLYNFTVTRIERLAKALNLTPYRIAAWLYTDRFCDLQEDPDNVPWQRVQPIFEKILNHYNP